MYSLLNASEAIDMIERDLSKVEGYRPHEWALIERLVILARALRDTIGFHESADRGDAAFAQANNEKIAQLEEELSAALVANETFADQAIEFANTEIGYSMEVEELRNAVKMLGEEISQLRQERDDVIDEMTDAHARIAELKIANNRLLSVVQTVQNAIKLR